MVAINTFNTDYPMMFICYDNISSKDKTFKKTWNLQAVQEPEVSGSKTVIRRDDYDFSGKLVINTMLPKEHVIEKVGGKGFESYVDGKNYPNEDYPQYDNEQCDWRLEVSPKNSALDDMFLNAMYVTDSDKNLQELPMYQEDNGAFVGVSAMDKTVLFSKTRKAVTTDFTFEVRNNGFDKMSVLITDVAAGKWNIVGAGTNIIYEVKEGENAIYAKLAPGAYTVSKAVNDAAATQFEYARNENVQRLGDFMIYNISARNFAYNRQPTILKDGQPYLSEDDYKATGATVTRNGESYTLKNLNHEAVITLGNLNAVFNQIPTTLTSAPFINESGMLYINALDMSKILGFTVSYDEIARILKITKKASVSLTASASSAVAGKDIMLTAEKTLVANDLQLVYNINGVDSEPTSSITYNAEISQGKNTAIVKAVDGSGNVVLTSNEVTFNGMPYSMTWVKEVNFSSSWYMQNVLFPNVIDNNESSDDEVKCEVIDLSSSPDDAAVIETSNDRALRFKVSNTGNDYNQKAEALSYKKDYMATEAVAAGADIISLKWKLKLVSMGKEDAGLGNIFYKNSAGQDKAFLPFLFTTDGKLKVATSLYPSAADANHRIEILAPAGQWYSFEFIADGKNGIIYLMVNDVVCSSFTFDDVAGDSTRKFDVAKSLSSFYTSFVLGFGGVGTATNEVYLADYQWYCAKSATDLYTNLGFSNSGNVIAEKAAIDYRAPLDIKLDAYNNGNDIMCIAAVLDNNQRVISVDTQYVSFAKGEGIKGVDLRLAGLPDDIATNQNYSIMLMLWNGATLAPINDVIPFN
jgi:hypothetical protein